MTLVTHSAVIYLLVAVLSIPASNVIGQNKQTKDLEKRIELLEQRIKVLEERLSVAFGGKGEEIRQVNRIMLQDFRNIADAAHKYILHPENLKGGRRTFVGFILPPGTVRKDLATYALTISESEIVIEGRPTTFSGSMQAHVGIDGALRNWTYTGDFVEAHNLGANVSNPIERRWEDFNNEMTAIADLAHQYRTRPRNGGGGGGSYAGFVIPVRLAATSVGWYRVIREDTSLVIEGFLRNSNTFKEVVFDGDGKIERTVSSNFLGQLKKPSGAPMSAADSLREVISNDFTGIATRAFEYRKRSMAEAGGGGSYIGYLSAQIASTDGNARYEILPDANMILLTALSTRGLGSVRAVVDASGRVSGWYYTGELAK